MDRRTSKSGKFELSKTSFAQVVTKYLRVPKWDEANLHLLFGEEVVIVILHRGFDAKARPESRSGCRSTALLHFVDSGSKPQSRGN